MCLSLLSFVVLFVHAMFLISELLSSIDKSLVVFSSLY